MKRSPECLHPETGSSYWQFRYATAFEDPYGCYDLRA